MKQTLLLGFMLTLVVACGSGSPEPSVYTPDDLVSALPTQAGYTTLAVEGSGGSEYLAEILGEDVLERLLTTTEYHINTAEFESVRIAPKPEDVRFALASSGAGPDEPRLLVYAIRVDGMPARYLPSTHPNDLVGELEHPYTSSRGKCVLEPGQGHYKASCFFGSGGSWFMSYPKGEVLFVAADPTGELDATSEDVLLELPMCYEDNSPTEGWNQPC